MRVGHLLFHARGKTTMKRLLWVVPIVAAISLALRVFLPASFFTGTALAAIVGLVVLASGLVQDARRRP